MWLNTSPDMYKHNKYTSENHYSYPTLGEKDNPFYNYDNGDGQMPQQRHYHSGASSSRHLHQLQNQESNSNLHMYM